MVSGQLVVSCRNTPEVLQPVERIFDPPAQPAQTLVKGERLLPVAAVRNDRFGPALVQLLAQRDAARASSHFFLDAGAMDLIGKRCDEHGSWAGGGGHARPDED